METYGFRLAKLPVRFRPPHPIIVVLVIALMLVPVSAEADINQYYSLAPVSDAGIMPLDLTDSQSTWLNQIYTYVGHNSALGTLQSLLNDVKNKIDILNGRLYYSNNSVAYYLYNIDNNLKSVLSNQSTMLTRLSSINSNLLYDGRSLAYWASRSSDYLYDYIGPALSDGNSVLNSILDELKTGNSKDWPLYTGRLNFAMNNGPTAERVVDMPFMDALFSTQREIQQHLSPYSGQTYLKPDGSLAVYGQYVNRFSYYLNDALVALARRMSADDRRTAFTFLAEDITQPAQTVTADNLLDAIGVMGTQLQNPLQRLAYVFANPVDLEIRENVSDNTEAANENFFKPGSAGSVSGGNIKDAAGLTSGAGDLLKSPVSVGAGLGQLTNEENYNFFSERTYHELNTVRSPSPASEFDPDDFLSQYEVDEDGFVDFYKPGNSALFDILGKGG